MKNEREKEREREGQEKRLLGGKGRNIAIDQKIGVERSAPLFWGGENALGEDKSILS